MDKERKYPVSYSPIPRVSIRIKKEPEDGSDNLGSSSSASEGVSITTQTLPGSDNLGCSSSASEGPKIRPVFPHKCGKCGRTYKHKSSLAAHTKYECGVIPKIQCTLCDHRSLRVKYLRKHMIAVHNVPCAEAATIGAPALEVHPFKCDPCGKTFKTRSAVKQHLIRVCDVDRSVACTKCPYRAKLKSVLKEHLINIHDGAGLSELEA